MLCVFTHSGLGPNPDSCGAANIGLNDLVPMQALTVIGESKPARRSRMRRRDFHVAARSHSHWRAQRWAVALIIDIDRPRDIVCNRAQRWGELAMTKPNITR